LLLLCSQILRAWYLVPWISSLNLRSDISYAYVVVVVVHIRAHLVPYQASLYCGSNYIIVVDVQSNSIITKF